MPGWARPGFTWREYVEHPDGFKRAARRATDRAKRWLRREKKRRHTEDRAWFDAMALAGAMYGRDDVALPTDASDVPVLVQLELEQLRRLVDALDKPESLSLRLATGAGNPAGTCRGPTLPGLSAKA